LNNLFLNYLCILSYEFILILFLKNIHIQLDDIEQIDRFREPPQSGIMCDLLWSDPSPDFGPHETQVNISSNVIFIFYFFYIIFKFCLFFFFRNLFRIKLEDVHIISHIRLHANFWTKQI